MQTSNGSTHMPLFIGSTRKTRETQHLRQGRLLNITKHIYHASRLVMETSFGVTGSSMFTVLEVIILEAFLCDWNLEEDDDDSTDLNRQGRNEMTRTKTTYFETHKRPYRNPSLHPFSFGSEYVSQSLHRSIGEIILDQPTKVSPAPNSKNPVFCTRTYL